MNVVGTTDYGLTNGIKTYNTPQDYVITCNTYLSPKIYHVDTNTKVGSTGIIEFEFRDYMGKNIPIIEYDEDATNEIKNLFFLLFKIELELITNG
jgi:hypothetical protein